MRQLRVLQISAYFYPSYRGTEYTVAELSRALVELGHKVDLLTVNTEGAAADELFEGVKVHRCAPSLRYRRGVLSPELGRRLIKARGYDIYHIHIPFHGGLEMALLASRRNKIPLLANHHGESPRFSLAHGIIDGTYRRFYRAFCLPRLERTFFFTRSYPDSLGLGAATLRNLRVVRPAVDTERFSPDKDGSTMRARHGFKPDDPVVLFVSGLMPGDERRGIHYLIAAMDRVRLELPSARLVAVGDGKLLPGLKQAVLDRGLSDTIVFTGKVLGQELAEYYAMCDIFAFPTTYEPFGFVVQEAMASGKPVVVSDIPGVGEMVAQGETGLKVPPRDDEALARAIVSLLSDRELRRCMGLKARQSVEGRTWMDVAGDIDQVYQEVVDSKDGMRTKCPEY
ncbi:MAG: glycosyltransferase family 4 protein [Chloroflexi bacterium]|nr:glycosyltransferase family 4 protein [Chloroflexota bacterium]